MKVSIQRDALLTLIGSIQAVVPNKPTLPILANILLEAYNDSLTLTATDLTVSMRASLPATIEHEGSITLPARRFFQLVRELTIPSVEIECQGAETAYISAGTSRFKLNGMHRDEFPSLPHMAGARHYTLPAPLLKELFVRTSFAAAREDSRHVLNGILFQVEGKRATAIGTDGKRLARASLDLEEGETLDQTFLIPLKAVEEMTKLSDGKELARLSLADDKVAVEYGGTTLITKLLSGQYPDVNRVIPDAAPITLSLHREELSTLLRQISLFTSERSHSVHFIFQEGELHIEAASSDIGEGRASMPVDYRGESLQIAFNPHYFLDILKHCRDETVTFQLTDPYNPGLITDSTGALFVIMPMRIASGVA